MTDTSPTLPGLQTSQGVPVRRFQTLGELISLYAQPNQGLVCALLLPVEREREPDPPDDRDASGAAWVPCTFPAPHRTSPVTSHPIFSTCLL